VRDARIVRRFAVILCADVVGYSRLMGLDEEGTLAALNAVRGNLIDPQIAEHGGRIVRTAGDGLLVKFDSVVGAVECAVAIQRGMPKFAAGVPPDRQIRFRIGINMGDVVSDGDLIHGDGVAVASRLESLAEPGGINVSRAVRDAVRDRLPIAFDDRGEHEVRNIVRPVRVFRIVLDEAAAPSPPPSPTPDRPRAAGRRAPALPAPPALAVLPFQNLGGDAETEFFLDSLAEDLITELARARWFSVVARNTSFGYKAKRLPAKQIAQQLGVRYLVEGSLRKAGNRVRINCQLIDAPNDRHLWAERFDGTLDDSFDLQDRIIESVIGSVSPVLRQAEVERARRKPEASLDAYDLILRAFPPAFAETPQHNEEALLLLARALDLAPAYPIANALAAWCHQQRYVMEWPAAGEDEREKARRLARAAIAAGADTPLPLALAAAVRAAVTRDHDLASAAVDRALMLYPDGAAVLGFAALARCLCGAYEAAIAHAEKAMRLSPLEPLISYAAFALALACLFTDRSEEAVAHAKKAIEGTRNFALPYCVLAAGAARLGHTEEAARAVVRLRDMAPQFRLGSLRRIRFADAARLLPDLGRLRAAGLPE
jgi:TolB-like protein/class 3 adenylate cyclase